jgi:anti-sigma B factor antagonist
MNFSCRAAGPVDVVSFAGALDASNAPRTRDELKSRITAGRSFVVIDLEHVTFVDSTGLSVLVSAFKVARERDGEVVLAALQAPVRTLVELTRLHHVFRIYGSVQDAISDLAPRALSGPSRD